MINQGPQIEFILRGRENGVEITPDTIGLSQFNDYNHDVESFLMGSARGKLEQVHVKIETSSYKLLTILTASLAAALEPDLQALQRQDSLGEIDPARAKIVAKWQASSKGKPDFHYLIRPLGMSAVTIELNRDTDFRVGDAVPWVKVEKYLFGTVVDMGGAQDANVHLRLADTGKVVRIDTNQNYLKDQKENHLYHKVLARVEAEQHHVTGQLRRFRLLSFESYEPRYDAAALDRFADAGTKAWADVPDAAEWVRQLRGGS